MIRTPTPIIATNSLFVSHKENVAMTATAIAASDRAG